MKPPLSPKGSGQTFTSGGHVYPHPPSTSSSNSKNERLDLSSLRESVDDYITLEISLGPGLNQGTIRVDYDSEPLVSTCIWMCACIIYCVDRN